MRGVKDRVALVTGAGAGIGRAIALRLAAEGARIAVTDLNETTAGSTGEAVCLAAVAGMIDFSKTVAFRHRIAVSADAPAPCQPSPTRDVSRGR